MSLNAQDNNSKYFDDGKVPVNPNVLKFDMVLIQAGELALFYERALTHAFTVELGVGMLLSSYNPKFPPLLLSNNIDGDVDGGVSWSVFPRYYMGNDAPESFYVGLQFLKRNFDQGDDRLGHSVLTANVGYQWNAFKWVIIDVYSGFGFYNETGLPTAINDTNGLAVSVGARIAISF